MNLIYGKTTFRLRGFVRCLWSFLLSGIWTPRLKFSLKFECTHQNETIALIKYLHWYVCKIRITLEPSYLWYFFYNLVIFFCRQIYRVHVNASFPVKGKVCYSIRA